MYYSQFMYDPLYKEFVSNTSDLVVYLARHFFIELVLPLSIFSSLMLILFVDWSWLPISPNERERGLSLEAIKKNLIE